jgi:hypothetical protein
VDQLALFNVIDNTPMVPTTAPEDQAPLRVPTKPTTVSTDWRLGFVLLDMVNVAGVPNWSEDPLGAGVIVGFNDQTQMADVDLPRSDGKAHIYTASPSRLSKIEN